MIIAASDIITATLHSSCLRGVNETCMLPRFFVAGAVDSPIAGHCRHSTAMCSLHDRVKRSGKKPKVKAGFM